MADAIYNYFKSAVMQGTYKLDTNTLYCTLATNSYIPDVDNDTFIGHIIDTAGLQVSGVAYTSPGVVLTVTVDQDNTDNEGVLNATDVSWTPATFGSAQYAVIWSSDGGSLASPLICAVDLGTDSSTGNYWAATAGTFAITWNAEGILNLN